MHSTNPAWSCGQAGTSRTQDTPNGIFHWGHDQRSDAWARWWDTLSPRKPEPVPLWIQALMAHEGPALHGDPVPVLCSLQDTRSQAWLEACLPGTSRSTPKQPLPCRLITLCKTRDHSTCSSRGSPAPCSSHSAPSMPLTPPPAPPGARWLLATLCIGRVGSCLRVQLRGGLQEGAPKTARVASEASPCAALQPSCGIAGFLLLPPALTQTLSTSGAGTGVRRCPPCPCRPSALSECPRPLSPISRNLGARLSLSKPESLRALELCSVINR